ncbi:MAG: 3-deoxy-D-manno-octulosonic acid transferase [Chitinophagaceae bacterium]
MWLTFFVYDIIIQVYAILIRISSIFNPKAREWVNGRKRWALLLKNKAPEDGVDIWMHCASLGEFEQGRPVLEALRNRYPDKYILLTFFSPSGYSVRKDYPTVNHVCYLPLDTRKNTRMFLQIIKPKLVIFVKYEFWLHFIRQTSAQEIPLLLVSAIFRPDQLFFKSYGKVFRQLLSCYNRIFVQDKNSFGLLKNIGTENCIIAGDTRFDRVITVRKQAKEFSAIDIFLDHKDAWVAGSTWQPDEQVIKDCMYLIPKWIIAPHEIEEDHLLQIEKLFYGKTIRYSLLKDSPEKYIDKNILLIDNVGMLSSLYRYGRAAYIGGGFGHGIHNILEAAVYGIPVIFGPKFQKFREAKVLIEMQAAFSISDEMEMKKIMNKLTDKNFRKSTGELGQNYVSREAGATEKIIRFIQEKRFLTN